MSNETTPTQAPTLAELRAVNSPRRGIAQNYWLGVMTPQERGQVIVAIREVQTAQVSSMRTLRDCHAYVWLTMQDAVWDHYVDSGMQELNDHIGVVITRN